MFLNDLVAEREGFEPPIPVKVWLISSQLHSTGLCHLSARAGWRVTPELDCNKASRGDNRALLCTCLDTAALREAAAVFVAFPINMVLWT